MRKFVLAVLAIAACITEAQGEQPNPVYADQPDSSFFSHFATYAVVVGVDPTLAVADARTIFLETRKPWTETIDENGIVDRPGKYIGVIRHLSNGAARRHSEDGWVKWLTVCHDHREKNGGISCEIELVAQP